MSIKKAYNSWAISYDTNNNKTRDLDKKVTKTVLSKYEFKNVLELGCGTGKNTAWLLDNVSTVIGLDFSKEMLNIAKQKLNSDKVILIETDLTIDWEVKNSSIDLVTCSLTLEHISNLDFIFNQVFKKLENKGLFFICELHPFKQYLGSKAQFQLENKIVELETYTHHISEYMNVANQNNFKLIDLNEWFDHDNNKLPRLISFVFQKLN